MTKKQVVKTTVRLGTTKVKSTPVAHKKVGLSVQSKIRAGKLLREVPVPPPG